MKYSIGLAPSPLFLEGVQGLDTIKEMDDFAEQPLLDQGLATLTLDEPGIGEARLRGIRLRPRLLLRDDVKGARRCGS